MRSEEEEGGGLHLVLLLNPVLRDVLHQHGLKDVVTQASFMYNQPFKSKECFLSRSVKKKVFLSLEFLPGMAEATKYEKAKKLSYPFFETALT